MLPQCSDGFKTCVLLFIASHGVRSQLSAWVFLQAQVLPRPQSSDQGRPTTTNRGNHTNASLSNLFLFVSEWIFQIFLFHLVSTSICRLSGEWLPSQSTLLRAGGWHYVAISETATTSLTPTLMSTIWRRSMSVHCFLTSCTFQVAEVVSTVHPRAAIFLLPYNERLCLYFTFKELDCHWRKEKNMKKMKMSSHRWGGGGEQGRGKGGGRGRRPFACSLIGFYGRTRI